MDRDGSGNLRFHYTVIDFAARWRSGEPVAGDDADSVAWAMPGDYDRYGLTDLVRRVIGEAFRLS